MGASAEAGYELMHRVYGICGVLAGLVLIAPEASLLWWLRQGYVVGVTPAWTEMAIHVAALVGAGFIVAGAFAMRKRTP